MASSSTGGVKPFAIAGRTVRERERIFGMSPEERLWRKQWLKDQELSHHEPKYVAEYWKQRINPIRRFYKAPLDYVYNALTPVVGQRRAFAVRFWTGKAAMSIAFIYATAYYFKYNSNDWTRKGGWRVISSRQPILPGETAYPKISERTEGADYAARGFKQAEI